MAAIYSYMDDEPLAEGLQGSDVCDEALDMALDLAEEYSEPVLLVDDDGEWIVHPDGTVERYDPGPADTDWDHEDWGK